MKSKDSYNDLKIKELINKYKQDVNFAYMIQYFLNKNQYKDEILNNMKSIIKNTPWYSRKTLIECISDIYTKEELEGKEEEMIGFLNMPIFDEKKHTEIINLIAQKDSLSNCREKILNHIIDNFDTFIVNIDGDKFDDRLNSVEELFKNTKIDEDDKKKSREIYLDKFKENFAKICEYPERWNSVKEYDGIKNWAKENYDERIFLKNLICDSEVACDLIEELSQKQEISIYDIEYSGFGYYNSVYKIGEYILKINHDVDIARATILIPPHRRILKSLIRNYNDKFFIEIQDVVDASWYNDKSPKEIEEVLYSVYKELRDDGIVWTDIAKNNVGKTLKPNTGKYKIGGEYIVTNKDGNPLTSDDEGVNIIRKDSLKREEVLDKGEYAVIDTDCIYYEDAVQIMVPEHRMEIYNYFNERYNKEKARKNEKIKERDF